MRFFENDGAGRFSAGLAQSTTFELGIIEPADWDGDGDVDFVLIGAPYLSSDPPDRFLYRNNRLSTNGPPIPPTNLLALTTSSRVDFSWDHSSSNVSFNLRVGTLPGANDIFSAAASSSGKALLPGMGNVQTSHQWHLGSLPPGKYYWSVQALDYSFRGSPFAPEQTFVIAENAPTPPAPTISSLSPVFTREDEPFAPISFQIGPESELTNLTVSVISSNPDLVPISATKLTGAGTNRILQITPAPNQAGDSFITLRIEDRAGQSAETTFLASIAPVNDPPQIDPIPNQITYPGIPLTLIVNASDVEGQLHLTASSSNPSVLPSKFSNSGFPSGTNLIISPRSPNSSYWFTINPLTNVTGSTIITVAADDGELTNSVSFPLSILPNPFTASKTNITPSALSAFWFDVDNDGDLDLYENVASSLASVPKLFRRDGTNLVETNFDFGLGTILSVTPFDANSDNRIDLLVFGTTKVALLTNSGGAFGIASNALPSDLSPGGFPLTGPVVHLGDMDNDGDVDLMVTGNDFDTLSPRAVWLRNNAGKFTRVNSNLPQSSGAFLFGDLDLDGRLDVIQSTRAADGSGTNRVFLQSADTPFQFRSGGFDLPQDFGEFGFCDYNNDGRPDLWFSRFSTTRLYRHAGDHYEFAFEFSAGASGRTLWADLNNDGYQDLITFANLAGFTKPLTENLTYFRNDSANRFTAMGNFLPGFSTQFLALADIDSDGDLDLLGNDAPPKSSPFPPIPPNKFGALYSFTNNFQPFNPPPGAPGDLRAEINTGQIIFSWTAPEDLNQSGGFTYNLRVGSAPGASDIMSPLALPSGRRLIAAAGNASGRTSHFLRITNKENIFWSVHAIDNSLAGGPFSPEQRVYLPQPNNQPPVISVGPELRMNEDTVAEVPLQVSDDFTPAAELSVNAFSSSPLLISTTNLSILVTNSQHLLRIRPATNQFGSATIRIEARDAGGLSSVTNLSLVVSNVNDAPVFAPIGSQVDLTPESPFDVPLVVLIRIILRMNCVSRSIPTTLLCSRMQTSRCSAPAQTASCAFKQRRLTTGSLRSK